MKITKTQLKQIIKEELEETGFQSGPVGGADDVAMAAYQLGRFFGGKLAYKADVIAQALEKVGAPRAAQHLRRGAQSADPA